MFTNTDGTKRDGSTKIRIIDALQKYPNKTNGEIAKEAKATNSYVSSIRKELGLRPRHCETLKMRVVNFVKEEIEKPLNERMNIKQISEATDCSYRYCAEIIAEVYPEYESLTTMHVRKKHKLGTIPVGVYVDDEMMELLEKEAIKKDVKFSTIIREIIEDNLEKNFGKIERLHTCKEESFLPNKREYRERRRKFPILLYTRLVEEEVVLLDKLSRYRKPGSRIEVHNRQKTIRNFIRARFGIPIDASQRGREHNGGFTRKDQGYAS